MSKSGIYKNFIYLMVAIASYYTDIFVGGEVFMEDSLDILLMGERLRACRQARKQTMKEFANMCGISERYLADIERGLKAPKLETFVKIVNAARISPEYLLQDSLTILDSVNLVQNALDVLSDEQKEIFKNFIIQLANSMK